MLHHGLRATLGEVRLAKLATQHTWRLLGWAVTMLAVVVAWVVFRAETFPGALNMWGGMLALGTVDGPHPLLWNAGLQASTGALWCAALAAMAFLAPNSNLIGTRLLDRCRAHPMQCVWLAGASLGAVLLLLLVNATRDSVSAFIYFNF